MEQDPFAIVESALNAPVRPDNGTAGEFVQAEPQKALETKPGRENEELNSPGTTLATENLQESFKRAAAVYKKYQDNIRKAQTMKSEILIGAKNGDDLKDLLLKAAVCIGCLTGDSKVYAENMKQYLMQYRDN